MHTSETDESYTRNRGTASCVWTRCSPRQDRNRKRKALSSAMRSRTAARRVHPDFRAIFLKLRKTTEHVLEQPLPARQPGGIPTPSLRASLRHEIVQPVPAVHVSPVAPQGDEDPPGLWIEGVGTWDAANTST